MELRLVNDLIFKAVFGTEGNKKVLISLLNAILDYPADERIAEIEILNPYSELQSGFDKLVVMDIKARDKFGRLYNIEMQISPPLDYVNRAVYYLAKLFSSQLVRGESYRWLAKSIGISIISDGYVFRELPDVHNIFRYKHITSNMELNDPTEIHFVELNKFDKTKPAELRTKLEKWLNFLKFGEEYKSEGILPKELESEEEIAMAMETYTKVTESDKFRQMIADREKARTDIASEIFNARYDGLEQGRKQGLEQGLEQGLQQGLEQGFKQGTAQGVAKERAELIKSMLLNNIPIESIERITGLSEEYIRKLISQ